MILYSGVAVVTILLGLLVDNRRKRQNGIVTRQQILNVLSLVSVFLILFALSACRLNVGNDYAKYVEFMHLVNCDAFVPTEARITNFFSPYRSTSTTPSAKSKA